MTNILKTGAAWMAEQLAAHATVAGRYHHAGESFALSVTLGRSDFEELQVDSTVRAWQSHDLIFAASLLVLYGKPFAPTPDDFFIADDDGAVYRVTSPDGERCWRPEDHFGVLIRLHTIRSNADADPELPFS